MTLQDIKEHFNRNIQCSQTKHTYGWTGAVICCLDCQLMVRITKENE